MTSKKHVIINNDMNLIPLRYFSPNEQNIFYGLCIKMRNKGLEKIEFTFNELREISCYVRNSTAMEFAQELGDIYDKLIRITCRYTEGLKIRGFVLFIDYCIDPELQIATISVNPNFAYLLNNISKNFTKFEMMEFAKLTSTYAKTAYRLLKQYKYTGCVYFEIEEFREIFCIPKSYKMGEIDRSILNPIKRELSGIFKGLEVKKIKAKKGRKIEGLKFYFIPESDQLSDGTFAVRNGEKYEKKHLDDMSKEELDRKFPDVPEHLK